MKAEKVSHKTTTRPWNGFAKPPNKAMPEDNSIWVFAMQKDVASDKIPKKRWNGSGKQPRRDTSPRRTH